MTPRIPPGSRRDVGIAAWWIAVVSGRFAGTTPPKLFLTLGRHRPLFRAWLWFAGHLMPGGTLPRRDTELVILRVGHLSGCMYEVDQHERLGRRAGLTEAEIARVAHGPEAENWGPRDAAILRAVDALHTDRDLTDEMWDDLRDHLDETSCIELLLLVGHYEMLATTINTLRIDLDRPRRARR